MQDCIQRRILKEVKEREIERNLKLGTFGPWSPLVESGGTRLFGSAWKDGRIKQYQPLLPARYLHLLGDPCTKKWLNTKVLPAAETQKACN